MPRLLVNQRRHPLIQPVEIWYQSQVILSLCLEVMLIESLLIIEDHLRIQDIERYCLLLLIVHDHITSYVLLLIVTFILHDIGVNF